MNDSSLRRAARKHDGVPTHVRRASRLLALLSAALLGACSLAPAYNRPPLPVPADWPAASGTTGMTGTTGTTGTTGMTGAGATGRVEISADRPWKQTILDPQLRALVDLALTNNRDLRKAVLSIEAARAMYGIDRAAQFPAISGQWGVTRERISAHFLPPGMPGTWSTYRASVGLADFELDAFGRVRDLSEAARHEYVASMADAQMARIGLIAEVSNAYVTLLAAERAVWLTRELADNWQRDLRLALLRTRAGTITSGECADVRALAASAAAEAARAERDAALARHALQRLIGTSLPDSVLEGRLSGKPERGERAPDVDGLFASVTPDLPSGLLVRRPDILAAESRLRGRHASIGAARAAFFPRIALTAAAGGGSLALSDLFSGPARVWQFAPRIELPIFTGGANRANLDLAKARRDIAVTTYEGTIQTAFAEVADALAARRTLVQQVKAQQEGVRDLTAAAKQTQRQYAAGTQDYSLYLGAQRRLMGAQLDLVQTQRDLAAAHVNLYRALGGGWRETSTPVTE